MPEIDQIFIDLIFAYILFRLVLSMYLLSDTIQKNPERWEVMYELDLEFTQNFLGICIFGVVVSLYMCRRYIVAWSANVSTGKEFNSWRENNPNLYVGTSEVARKLLAKHLSAYDRFLEVDKMHWDNGYRDYLLGLFLEIPPRYTDCGSVQCRKIGV